MTQLPPYRPPEAGDTQIRPKPGEEVCDFCSSPDVTWSYPARGHIMGQFGGVVGASHDPWAACDECRQLIASGNRDALLDRSAAGFKEMMGALLHPDELGNVLEMLREQVRGIHDRFWSNRDGAPVPFVKAAR